MRVVEQQNNSKTCPQPLAGLGLYNPRSELGDWELNCPLRSTEEDWSGSVEPFPANMDDLGKFAGAQRTAVATQPKNVCSRVNGGCRLTIFTPFYRLVFWPGVCLYTCLSCVGPLRPSRGGEVSPGSAKLSPVPVLRAPERPRRAGSRKLRDEKASTLPPFSAVKSRLCGDLVSRFVPRLCSARQPSDTSSLFHITQTGHAGFP